MNNTKRHFCMLVVLGFFVLSCDNRGGQTLSEGGTVSDQGVIYDQGGDLVSVYELPASVDPSAVGYDDSLGEEKSPASSRKIKISFDKDGNIIGMWGGAAYNPCKDKPCNETKKVSETPEMKEKTSLDWALVKKGN